MTTNFEIIEGDSSSKVILHVPHSSRYIPPQLRAGILLNDQELDRELDLMTDTATDQLVIDAITELTSRPWVFKNNLSRFVIDPERFPDDSDEAMSSVGMGAVYTKTASGATLRAIDAQERERTLGQYFRPYAQAFEDLVTRRLEDVGRVQIIDVHSYRIALGANELNGHLRRPSICIGVDTFHTSEALLKQTLTAFSSFEILQNEPFSGTYVPLSQYRLNPQVESVMIEIREDCLVDSSLNSSLEYPRTVRALKSLLQKL